jgi:NTE family protein
VAALIAAGLESKEILDPTNVGANIISRYNTTPVDLLGRREWNKFQTHRQRHSPLFNFATKKGKLWAAISLPLATKLGIRIWRRKGYFDTANIRKFLNNILREQLIFARKMNGESNPEDVPDFITFAHLDWSRFQEFIPLKILAANTSTREGVIFDRERTPDVEIAQAVAASIAIPFAFEPVQLSGERGQEHRFFDGGMISNLPVWAFANEKLAYERGNPGRAVPVVGFRLVEKADGAAPVTVEDGFIRYVTDGIATTLAGSQKIVRDFVEDLHIIDLHTSLKTLDFGATEPELLGGYQEGFKDASRNIRHLLIEKPQLVNDELKRVYRTTREQLLLLSNPPLTASDDKLVLRANIVERFGRDDFRVTYSHNMRKDADDRLPLDRRGKVAPLAFISRSPQFVRLGAERGEKFMTKYERALVPSKVSAILSVPIFETISAWEEPDANKRPVPCGVLSIDGNCAVRLEKASKNANFMAFLAGQSTLLYPALTKEL